MEIDLKHTLYEIREYKVPKKHKDMRLETYTSRKSAIKQGEVSVLALSGIDSDIREYLGDGRVCWQFEPNPDFEKRIAAVYKSEYNNAFDISVFGKEVLWRHMHEAAERIEAKTGRKIELDFLTPYEAVSVIEEVIKHRVIYDDLVATSGESKLLVGNRVKTLRPELVDLFGVDDRKFAKGVEKLRKEVNKKTADQIIESGFAVCRHISASTSTMYGLLKERQKGILLNGTYMIYHSESIGDQASLGLVGNLAYDILAVTSPDKKASFSIIDLTFALDENGEVDYTWRRISQVCSFLHEFGGFLKIDNVDEITMGLAEKGCRRLEEFFVRADLPLHSDTYWAIYDFLADYVSLLSQTSVGRDGKVAEYIADLYENQNSSRERALCDLLGLPSFVFRVSEDKRVIRSQRLDEINGELQKVDFSKDQTTEKYELWYTLGETISGFSVSALEKQVKDKTSLKSEGNIKCLELVGNYVRGYVESGGDCFEVKDNIHEIVCLAIAVAKKHSVGGDLIKYGDRFLKMAKSANK